MRAVYRKNLFTWESVLRIVGGVGLVGASWLLPWPWWARTLLIATAVILVVTGAVGYCPACAMLGRRPVGERGSVHQ